MTVTGPDLSPGHLVLGECAGFVRADVIGTAHSLAGGKLLDEVLILEHLRNGV